MKLVLVDNSSNFLLIILSRRTAESIRLFTFNEETGTFVNDKNWFYVERIDRRTSVNFFDSEEQRMRYSINALKVFNAYFWTPCVTFNYT